MKKLLSTICCLTVLTSSLVVAAPIPTYAQRAVVEVGPNVAQNTINAAANTLTSTFASALNIKEFTLDGIAYGITRTIIQSMVRSIVNWINSGFQGSPAFVTDLQGHLRNIADQVVSDVLTNSELAFLCSPFQLDVRIAIAQNYNEQRDGLGFNPQCTLEDVTQNMEGFLQGSFSEGGWAGWFELTQGEANDPNAAYLDAQLSVNAAIRDAQGQAITELDWGDGFLSFRVCDETEAASGNGQDCTITTPGRVIADQLNGALGAGRDALITADEINEIIGALLAQLAQQALTGAYGLLGLGGNSSYTDYSFGDDGTSSYLDALAVEQVNTEGDGASSLGASAFETSSEALENVIDAHYEIVARVTSAELDYTNRRNSLTGQGCSAPSWPSQLGDAQAESEAAIQQFELVATVLEQLETRFAAATTPQEQDAIMEQYLALQDNGQLPSSIDATQIDFFIEFDLRDDINDLATDLTQAENRCDDN